MTFTGFGKRASSEPVLRRLLIVLALVGLWYGYVKASRVQPFLLPSPVTVVGAIWYDIASGRLVSSLLVTLELLFVGTVIGLVLGVGLATLSIISRVGSDMLSVLTSVFNPLPGIGILPLAMLWFGLTPKAILFVISYAMVWPIALNIDTGFRTVSSTLLMVAENLGLRGIRLVLSVMVPAALPYIITGLKVAWAFGWRTVVAAELVFGVAGARAGIGWYISQARYFLETPRVFAGLATIAAVGMLFEYLFRLLERNTVEKWGTKK
jgi:NitT/TauT family transport system permease protein